MALEDLEKVTSEDIQKAATERPELITSMWDNLRETDHGKTYLQRHADNHFEEAYKPKIAKVHGKYDEDFEAITGIKKPAEAKSYEFWNEQMKALKERADSNQGDAALQQKVKDLQEQLEKADGDTIWKSKYDTLKAEYDKDTSNLKASNQKIQGELSTLSETVRKSQVTNEITKASSQLKFREDLDNDIIKSMVNTAEKNLLERAVVETVNGESVIVFKGEDGLTRKNMSTLAPLTASEILKEDLKSILGSRNQGGGGAGGNNDPSRNTTEIQGSDKEIYINAEGAKSKTELLQKVRKAAREQGITSKDYIYLEKNTMDKYGKGLPEQ